MKQVVYIVFGFTLLGAAAGFRAQAQEVRTLDPSKALTQYIHQTWQIDEGLPQNTVRAIAQTRDGYLWLGTEEGLVRFDGVRFTVFDKSNTAVFEAGHAIQALFEDRRGRLWIGTGAGLVRYASGRFTRYTTADGLTGRHISALCEDADGVLWAGTRDAGLFSLHDGRFTRYTTADGLSSDHVSALAQDRDGALWVGTQDGLNRVQDGRVDIFRHRDDGYDNFVLALHQDRDGVLWVGTRGGLGRLADGTLQPYAEEAGWFAEGVRALWEDAAGSLWMGMKGSGLGRLHAGRFEAFSIEDGLSHDWVLALYGDREGSLWIGTEGGGLNRLWDGKFTPVTTREGLSRDVVMSVFEDAEGSLWIGTDGGGLNRLRDGRVTAYTTRDGLSSDIVPTVYQDRDGVLWVGTLGGGLNRFQAGAFTSYTTREGFPSDAVYALYAASDGGLWIGTDAGLVHHQDGVFTTYTAADGLGSNSVTAVLEDRRGDLWVGTYDAGLSRLRQGRFTHYTTADGLGSNMVLALHEDADGVLWVGTYEGGLSRLVLDDDVDAQGTLTTYTTQDGLFNDKIYQILEDDDGVLWMSCNKGLFTVPKAALNAFAEGAVSHITSTAYGKQDGLKSQEMNGGVQPAGWKRRDGSLWFPSVQGAVGIDPQNVPRNVMPPPLVIEEVLVDGEPIALDGTVELTPGKKKYEFKYTALSFIAPEAVRFRYILDGYDSQWQDADAQRAATYTNLPPGTFTFRVMARNSDGVWNETGASVSFYLKPFFYQTGWFFALCMLASLLVGIAGYHLHNRTLRSRQRELEVLVEERTHALRTAKEKIEAQAEKLQELDRFKTRFFANVSHEFRTPLTMIVGPLENALGGVYGPLSDDMRQKVAIMLRNALRLMRLINQLLDLSKLEASKMQLQARPRNLTPFLEDIVLSCSAFAEQKGIALTLDAEDEEMALYYEPDKLEKVFFNLLSNATKFTPSGGKIEVTVARRAPTEDAPDGAVEIQVRDTGVGIPAEHLPHIFDRFHQVDGSNTREHEGTGIGLALVKELVLLHHGVIEARSEVGAGTVFSIVLPLGSAHLKPDELASEAAAEDFELDQNGDGTAGHAFSDLALLPAPANGYPATNGHTAPNGHAPELPPGTPLILVVEDNADVRDYVASILGQRYRVLTARDGEEGLAQAREHRPDLVISDVMMPRMDGNALCRALKDDPGLNHIPVVLLTARATQQMKIEGLEVGADDYLHKPFNAPELMARVQNLIQLRRQQKELKQFNETLEQQVAEQVETIFQERLAYEQQLLAAKDEAEASLRLKTAILDNMSHEFRTPLTAIQGYAQILSREVRDELQEFTRHIDQSGMRLMQSLDAVHQLSRLEAGAIDLHFETVDLACLVRETHRRFAGRAQEKGLTLRVEAPGSVKATLDAAAVERILQHLVDNALKFTDEGEVFVEAAQRGGQVELRVQDTGVGIDPAFLPHLFEAFTQESTGLTRTHDGIGIGLTIARRLTDLMGGSLTVESEKDRGSIFTVQFPLVAPADRRASAPSFNREPAA